MWGGTKGCFGGPSKAVYPESCSWWSISVTASAQLPRRPELCAEERERYLDDWILKHQDRASLIQEIAWLKAVICKVGLVVNEEKSQFVPTQRFVHIGIEYHLDVGLIFPPPHGQDLEDREFHPSVADCHSDNGSLLAIPARSVKFSSRCHSTRQIAFKASANIFVGTLGTNIKRLESTHSRETRSLTRSPGVVAEPVLHAGGNVSGSSRLTNSSFHRRIHYRLGRPSRNSVHNGNLDSPRSQVSHQSSGITGSEICSARISDLTAEKISSTDVGQCHGCGLSAQSRGDKIHPLISRQQRDSPLRSPPAYGPTSQTHSWREECISRPAISQGQSNSHRVDTQAVSSGCHLWGMGETQPSSVCYTAEQQASGLGVSHGRPSSSGSGCSVDVMERDVRLCFPSVCDIGESARKGAQRSPVRIDTGSPQMAQSVLVCQTVGSASRLSFAPAAEGRPPVSTSPQTETPVPTSGVSTRLEAVQRSLQERGFSQAASAQISRGRRQSSRVVYDSKWRLFSGWCEEQEVNPFEVTVPQLADFFIYLFNVKQLNPRTIKGYRSAISATVSAYGSRREFSDSPELSALLRSFMLERPPQRKILPQWSLPLILQVLLKPPFEPLQKSDLKHLTLKTVFLTALASGRRRSELHALCFDSAHFRQNQDQSLVILYHDIDFVAKSQVLDSVATPIKLQAFTSVGGRTRIGNSVRSGPCCITER